MTLSEDTFEIETPDGRMETFAVHPEGGDPHPSVILYMDAPGIRNELRDFCRRIAREGYYVLLPDMYYRLGRVRFRRLDDEERKQMFAAMRSLDAARGAGVIPIGVIPPGSSPQQTRSALERAGAARVLENTTDLQELLP